MLRSHLEMLLGGAVVYLSVIKLDLVDDTTLVDVRYRAPRNGRGNDATLAEPALNGSGLSLVDRQVAQ